MAGYELVHVAVAAPNIPEPDIIKKVATIVNKDPYQTRLLLSGGVPKLIAHYHSMQEAESTAQNLRDLGLVAFICKNSELHKPSKIFTAHTMEFLEGETIFRDKGGQTKRIAYSDVFLIIKGSVQTPTEEETTETKRKINWGATLLTGGIPIYHNVTEKISGVTVREEPLVRLYNRESVEPMVQMLQHGMAYSFLGAQIAPSSLANFNTVVAKLRELFPQAGFDDSLIKPSKSNLSSTRTPDDLELNCKLLYLYYKAKSGLSYQG
jgi:uncharacterized cupin superfamily protein